MEDGGECYAGLCIWIDTYYFDVTCDGVNESVPESVQINSLAGNDGIKETVPGEIGTAKLRFARLFGGMAGYGHSPSCPWDDEDLSYFEYNPYLMPGVDNIFGNERAESGCVDGDTKRGPAYMYQCRKVVRKTELDEGGSGHIGKVTEYYICADFPGLTCVNGQWKPNRPPENCCGRTA